MKRTIYIFLWLVLGYLLGFIAGNILEIIYIYIVSNYFAVPLPGHIAPVPYVWPLCVFLLTNFILPAVGILFGYKAGVYFWQVLYVEKRYRKWGIK